MFKKIARSKKLYLVFFLVVLIWVLFFDQSNLFQLYKLKQEKASLEKEMEFYSQEVEVMRLNRERLHSNEELLEAYARETYRMKKDNEDVYVIQEEGEN